MRVLGREEKGNVHVRHGGILGSRLLGDSCRGEMLLMWR